jgi:hypothetical protein
MRLVILLARFHQAVDSRMELWIVELPGDADGIRQVVVTEPDHVDAIHARISRWQWARDFRARGFRMIAYGVDTLLMQGALAEGLKLLRGTVAN